MKLIIISVIISSIITCIVYMGNIMFLNGYNKACIEYIDRQSIKYININTNAFREI